MQLPKPLHDWQLNAHEAIQLQKRLASMVKIKPCKKKITYVAGLDAAFTRDKKKCVAGVVIWNIARNQVEEECFAIEPVTFPYVPGLLSFREAPALLAALSKTRITPDLLMCDGQGIAHPRRMGIAAHLGLFTDLPTIGCAKSRLFGTHAEPGAQRGDRVALMDKDQVIGTVLRSRDNVRPLYISAGHHIDLTAAEELVTRCCMGYRLPEPTRLADKLVAVKKR